jgi:primase-polymerase (primpol)-like protein
MRMSDKMFTEQERREILELDTAIEEASKELRENPGKRRRLEEKFAAIAELFDGEKREEQ